MSRQCSLRCLFDSHEPISLSNGTETVIGRSKTTKIKDAGCSRQQLSIKPNFEDCIVEIKQLGINPSGLDGFALKKDEVYKVGHGSRIEVLLNQYIHIVEFHPPPDDYESPRVNNKRKVEDDETQPRKKKLIKTDMEKLSHVVTEAKEDIWEDVDRGELYIFTAKGVKSSTKIAAFDMDGTLIKTKSGKVHPVDTKDWQIAFPVVSQKIKELVNQGYKVCIMSNQAPIGNGRVKIEDFKKKIESIVEKIGVPIQVYLATGRGIYRKPATGMWKTLTEKKNDGLEVDMDQSFYCGDAVGRLANWAPGKKKDHSMADKLLAENLNLKFYTPEQFFLGHSIANVPIGKPEFSPKDLKSEKFNENLIGDEKEVLVMVGYPGSGKSFLAQQIEKKSGNRYAIVCRDVLGSWQKCAAEAKKLLERGKSVIVDSTNPDIESRGRWTSLAQQAGVSCRCVHVTTSKAHAQHNNKFRELMKINHLAVNDIVFHAFKNKFVQPSTNEGFKEVIAVNFNPNFDSEESERLYRMYLLEK